jgi:hypothetical protein
MTLHRSVITPPPEAPSPPSRLVDIVAMALYLAIFLSPALLYAGYLIQAQDTAAESRLQQLRERRVCPLALEVQIAMDRAEQVRIAGDGTCENPLRVVP